MINTTSERASDALFFDFSEKLNSFLLSLETLDFGEQWSLM